MGTNWCSAPCSYGIITLYWLLVSQTLLCKNEDQMFEARNRLKAPSRCPIFRLVRDFSWSHLHFNQLTKSENPNWQGTERATFYSIVYTNACYVINCIILTVKLQLVLIVNILKELFSSAGLIGSKRLYICRAYNSRSKVDEIFYILINKIELWEAANSTTAPIPFEV